VSLRQHPNLKIPIADRWGARRQRGQAKKAGL
jgi:hypothetical protein